MAPQPKPEWTPEALELLMEDFDLRNMDLAPTADPKSVTDMQRMMRAQYLTQFLGQPGINNQEIQRRQLEAANIEDIDKLFVQGPDPMQELEAEKLKAEVGTEKAKGTLTMAQAEKTRQEGMETAFDRGIKQGALAGGVLSVEDVAGNGDAVPGAGPDGGPGAGGMDKPFGN
jgi:hypothetical protein